MFAFFNNRRALLALTIAIAVVAVVIPTCRMIGCSMEMGPNGSMPMSGHFGGQLGGMARLVSDCGGEYLSSIAPEGVVPTAFASLMLALAAFVALTPLLFAPSISSRFVYVAYAEPPPRPLDPRGERLLI